MTVKWVCPSCGTEWRNKPLVEGTIGCPECGSVAERAMTAAENALAVGETAAAGWQAEKDARAAAEARAEAALQALVDLHESLFIAAENRPNRPPSQETLYAMATFAKTAALAGREQ